MSWLDIIFPRYCLGANCEGQQRLLNKYELGLLCPECRDKNLTWIDQPSCLRCGQWYGEGALTFDQCRNCIDQPHAYTAIRSSLVADEHSMELLKAWKYDKQVGIWQEMQIWTQAWQKHIDNLTEIHDLQHPLIVPVPTTRASYMKRGFNQAEWLAQELNKQLNKQLIKQLTKQTALDGTANYSDCLISKNKNKQARLLRSQRLKNPGSKGAASQQFDIKKLRQSTKAKLLNRDILLIDDICTTGATAHACAKVLKRELKARNVFLLTLLRKTW